MQRRPPQKQNKTRVASLGDPFANLKKDCVSLFYLIVDFKLYRVIKKFNT